MYTVASVMIAAIQYRIALSEARLRSPNAISSDSAPALIVSATSFGSWSSPR